MKTAMGEEAEGGELAFSGSLDGPGAVVDRGWVTRIHPSINVERASCANRAALPMDGA